MSLETNTNQPAADKVSKSGVDNPNESQFVNVPDKPSADKPVDNRPIEKPVDTSSNKPDEVNVNFDDFESVLSGALETKPSTAPEKKDDKKPEDKVDDKKSDNKAVDTSASKDNTTVNQPDINKRDFTGIEESDVPLFKKMANDAFNKLKPIYLEHKQKLQELEQVKSEVAKLKEGALPDSYNEHPRGYTLTPEFEVVASTALKAQQIVSHWESQLERVRQGEETYQELHINPQNGELYLSQPVAANKQSEDLIRRYLDGSKNQKQKFDNALQQMSQTHKTRYDQAVNEVKQFEAASFAIFDKPELKDKLGPIIKDTITKVLPPAFHNNPLAPIVAKSLYTIQQLHQAVIKLKEGKPDTAVVQQNGTQKIAIDESDKSKINPTNSDMSSSASSGGAKDDVTFDAFQEFTGRR